MIIFLLYLLLGLLTGIVSGLFGIGGGVVIVPSLFMLFTWQHFPHEISMHMAVATSLACITFSLASATFSHWRANHIVWKFARPLSLCMSLGGAVGVLFAMHVSGSVLQMIVGMMMIFAACQLIFSERKITTETESTNPSTWLKVIAAIIGALAAATGIGGAALLTPTLMRYRLSLLQAIGTTCLCATGLTLVGTIGFIMITWGTAEVPTPNLGFVYLPAALFVGLASLLTAPLGVSIAKRLKAPTLRYLFAGFLIILGVTLSLYK